MTRGTAAVVAAIGALLAAGAARLALGLENDSRPAIFLRADDPARVAYDDLVRTFGTDAFLVVTCRGDLGRAPELAAALTRSPAVQSVYLPSEGAPVAQALGLLGPGRISLAVALRETKKGGLGGVREVCARFPELKPGIAGEPALNRELEEASDSVGRELFPVLALTMAALLLLAYRSLRVVAAVFLATAVALLLGMASIALAGAAVNLVTILLPVLLLSLTVALSVHLVNAYRLHLAGVPALPRTPPLPPAPSPPSADDVVHAVRAMMRDEWRPCLVTSLTTAVGFGSFALARIDPLAELGRAMAVSILLSLATCFTLLPALLVLLRPSPREGLRIGAGLVRFVPALVPSRRAAYVLLLATVAAAAVAAPRVPRETNALHDLPATNALREETDRLAKEGVGTAALEIVLRPAPGAPLLDLAPALRAIGEGALRWRDEGVPHVRGAVTALTVADEAARILGPAARAFALAPAPAPLEERFAPFRAPAERVARASILIDPVDVEAFDALRERVDDLVRGALPAGATYEVTGEFPLVMTVQRDLLSTLLQSLLGTAATILVILAVSMRSIRLAALTLLPAVVPLGAVVLACALFAVPLSISTVMVLAVALGIVTDNSVHMLHAFTGGDALRAALRRVGTAVTETSIAIFLGFLVCTLSDFLPTRHFGLLTAFAMLVALLTDVLLFPALLRPRAPAAAPAEAPTLALEPEQ
ncbi:MAG TPA: MMPL family transporter [Planctomycetota bacterium]|nr:MMPL family transporter [Planctomycetota bacterium]